MARARTGAARRKGTVRVAAEAEPVAVLTVLTGLTGGKGAEAAGEGQRGGHVAAVEGIGR